MPKLSNIAITHISLVKAGANKKSIIYKSADGEPPYARNIEIKKSDDEQGIIYGIVYAPNEVDTDGDYTDVDEILKASYAFMKSRFTNNVDKDHSFEVEKAFVAESWIVKENDPIFPDEPVGSWAVGIKLEDEELKKGVKDGDIAGISMAGTATKTEEENPTVEKADEKNYSMNDFINMFKKLFGRTSFEISGSVYNDEANVYKSKEGEDNQMTPEEFEAALTKAMKPLTDQLGEMKTKVEALEKSDKETKEALKKSRQNGDVEIKKEETESETGGIL